MLHFFGRAILKLLFPFKGKKDISPEGNAELRAKYGFGTFLKTLFSAVFIIMFAIPFIEGILNYIQSLFAPAEKNGCLYFYAHQEQYHSLIALGLCFFVIRKIMKWWLKDTYDEVKLFLCLYTDINVIRFLRVIFTLSFLLGLLLKYSNSDEEVRFCNDSIIAINKSHDEEGGLMKGEHTFKYDSIVSLQYTKRFSYSNKGVKKNYTPNIDIIFLNDNSITINGYNWDASKEKFNPKIIERLIAKTNLQMDTVEVED
jgi:uncharacterized membrane protein